MGELNDRIDELLRRAKITTKCRYRASERLDRHHRASQWVVALTSVALVFIPLLQAFGISAGIDAVYLNATQATLAVLVLVYSLLLGQENFISRSQAMHRNGVELGRFSRKVAGTSGVVSDQEYLRLTEEYYAILEKYENHKPVDYQLTLLADWPDSGRQKFAYGLRVIKACVYMAIGFSHYLFAFSLVAYVFFFLFQGIAKHAA